MSQHAWSYVRGPVIFLSVNFDAEAFDLTQTTENRLFGRYSYGRYGVRAGLPRLLDVLDKHAIHSTFFVSGADAKRHLDAVREIAVRGHEVASRGMTMTDLQTLGDNEQEDIREGTEVLSDLIGKEPKGFRAVANSISGETLTYLSELGYAYDSSFQDDDFPYRVTTGTSRTLIEIPTCHALEDAPVYAARHTHSRVMAIWRDEYEALRDAKALIPLTLHLRGDVGSTRAVRVDALDTFLARAKSEDGARFMTGRQIAEQVMSLDLPAEPDPLSQHADTLSRVPYRGDLAITNSAYRRA